jgi:hypothetical protein
VACLALTYVSALSHKRHDFREKIKNKMHALIFRKTFVRSISQSEKNSCRYYKKCTHVHRSSCKVPVLLVRFQSNLNFLNRFTKKKIVKFHENPSRGSQTVPRGRPDMTKLIVAFRNVANALTNDSKSLLCVTSRAKGAAL